MLSEAAARINEEGLCPLLRTTGLGAPVEKPISEEISVKADADGAMAGDVSNVTGHVGLCKASGYVAGVHPEVYTE